MASATFVTPLTLKEKAHALYKAITLPKNLIGANPFVTPLTWEEVDQNIVLNIQELTNNGKDLDLAHYINMPVDGLPALFRVAATGLPQTASLLLQYAADSQSTDEAGNSALHFATSFALKADLSQLEAFCAVIKNLRLAGANSETANAAGQTPVALAHSARKKEEKKSALTAALTGSLAMHKVRQLFSGALPSVDTGDATSPAKGWGTALLQWLSPTSTSAPSLTPTPAKPATDSGADSSVYSTTVGAFLSGGDPTVKSLTELLLQQTLSRGADKPSLVIN